MKLNIREKLKNSILNKLINGGNVEEQDIENITTSPDDAATVMALRSSDQKLASSVANYKSGIGFVASQEAVKKDTSKNISSKNKNKSKSAPKKIQEADKGEDFEQEL